MTTGRNDGNALCVSSESGSISILNWSDESIVGRNAVAASLIL